MINDKRILPVSANGVEMIKAFEGVRYASYQDSAGVWTIGVGHTDGVKDGMVISEDQVDEYLNEDLEWVNRCLDDNLKVELIQDQIDALGCFIFNLGGSKFKHSTLLALINDGKLLQAADEFTRWIYAGGKKLDGLVRRRNAEKIFYLRGFKSAKEFWDSNWILP